ncbi:MAG TPA: hypothetical protein VG650_16275 [Mycobacteriales bacterium]|nr:hypothetical protein [Mycobacteriales bacterium]
MSRRDELRRHWTHRRLGLGAAAADPALARTEALLAAVGARHTPAADDLTGGFDAALFDLAVDIDLVAGVADIDAQPVPLAALRAGARRRRRPGWRVLVPVAGTGLAALAIVSVLLVTGGSTAGRPALSATAESQQLLTHADLLLTAATAATPAKRTALVAQARADLTHVSRLLPLAPPAARPAIRSQLQLLDRRARPLTPRPTTTTSNSGSGQPRVGGDDGRMQGDGAGQSHGTGSSGSSGSGTVGGSINGSVSGDDETPVRQRPPVRRPQQDAPAADNAGSGQDAVTNPPPSGTASGQPANSGTRPPPGSSQPRPPDTGGSGAGQPAPPPSGQRPR